VRKKVRMRAGENEKEREKGGGREREIEGGRQEVGDVAGTGLRGTMTLGIGSNRISSDLIGSNRI
jgi:hypothetical protein